MEYILVFFLSYLFGSIPFGLILTKLFNKKDLRKIGSGNIGATNVLRTGNKMLAVSTLILDVLKGYLPVLITQRYYIELTYLSSLIVFLAHIFPVWLNFKGGKGVATYLGILFALSLSLSILFIFPWIIVTQIFKYASVSSIFSSFTVLTVTVLRENVVNAITQINNNESGLKLILFIFFIFIIFTHRENISNLKNKKENKIKI